MKSHSGEESQSHPVANDTAQKKSIVSPSKLQAMVNNSPQVQQLKAYQLMANSSQPIQKEQSNVPVNDKGLKAEADMMENKAKQLKAFSPPPLIKADTPLAAPVQRLVNHEKHMKRCIISDEFKKNHVTEDESKFTLFNATKRAVSRGEGTNTIIYIDESDLKKELGTVVKGMTVDTFGTADNTLVPTAATYEWISSRPDHKKPKQKGGETNITVGLKKGKRKDEMNEQIWINHLEGDVLANDQDWVDEKEEKNRVADWGEMQAYLDETESARIMEEYYASLGEDGEEEEEEE